MDIDITISLSKRQCRLLADIGNEKDVPCSKKSYDAGAGQKGACASPVGQGLGAVTSWLAGFLEIERQEYGGKKWIISSSPVPRVGLRSR